MDSRREGEDRPSSCYHRQELLEAQVYVGFVPQVYVGIKIFKPENKIDAGRLRSTLRS